MRLPIVAAIIVGLLVPSYPVEAANQTVVNESVQRAVNWLWEEQTEDGYWKYGPPEEIEEDDDKKDDNDRRSRFRLGGGDGDEDDGPKFKDGKQWLGMTALAVMALYEAGVSPRDPRMRKALKYIREKAKGNEDTYGNAIALSALARIGRREDRALIRSLATKLVAAQTMAGGWEGTAKRISAEQQRNASLRQPQKITLGPTWLAQFVVMALWQARSAGADMEKSFRRVRQRLAFTRTPSGGWNYHTVPDLPEDATHTRAGLYMWILTSVSEGKWAMRKGETEVTYPEPREPRKSKPERIALREEKEEEGLEQEEIEEELVALKTEDQERPIDIYDAIQRGIERAKLDINRWRRGVNKSGTREASRGWPVAHKGYTVNTSGRKEENLIPPGEGNGELYHQFEKSTPPVFDVTKSAPLAQEEIFMKAFERVNEHAKNGIGGRPYDLWQIQRLASIMGIKTLGGRDWYDEGARRLLSTQLMDGSWGLPLEEREEQELPDYNLPETCYAILFLTNANVGREATRMLEPPPTKPFAVENGGEFKEFTEAYASVGSGATIIVRGDGPYKLSGVRLDKPVTIRAEEGWEPVLAWDRPKNQYGFPVRIAEKPEAASLFIVPGKVTFEGIHFQMDPTDNASDIPWTMFKCLDGSRLELLNCTLSESVRSGVNAVHMDGASKAIAHNCFFCGFQNDFYVETDSQAAILAANCLTFSPTFLVAKGTGSVGLWLFESTVQSDDLVEVGDLKGEFVAQAEHCIFRTAKIFGSLGTGPRQWDGGRNLYDNRGWISDGPPKANNVRTLSDWRSYFRTAEKNSKRAKAPIAVYRLQLGPFRHDTNPLDWSVGLDELRQVISASESDQVGANPFAIGPGIPYARFRSRPHYDVWKKAKPPSMRTEEDEEPSRRRQASIPTSTTPSLLKMIPPEARAALVVRDLGKLDRDLQSFAQSAGIALPPGIAPSQMMAQTPLAATFDPSRGLAAVAFDTSSSNVAFVAGVTDEEETLRNLNAVTQGDYHQANMPGSPPLALLLRDNTAILSPDPDILPLFENPGAGILARWTEDERDLYEASNLFGWASIMEFRPEIEAQLSQSDELVDMIESNPGLNMSTSLPSLEGQRDVIKDYLRGVMSFLSQINSISLGVSISDQAITARGELNFASGSTCQKLCQDRPPAAKNLLAGLPGGTYSYAAGIQTAGFSDVLKGVAKTAFEASKGVNGIDADQLDKQLAAAEALLEQLKGANKRVSLDTNGNYVDEGLLAVGDSAAVMTDIKTILANSTSFVDQKYPGAKLQALTPREQDGIASLRLQTDLSRARGPLRKGTESLFGGTKIVQEFAPLTGNVVGYSTGVTANAYLPLRSGEATLADSPAVQTTLGLLPSRPYGIALFNVAETAKVAKRSPGASTSAFLSGVEGSDPSTPPIGAALTLSDTGAQGVLVIPSGTAGAIGRAAIQGTLSGVFAPAQQE
ncbi:A-macroglobulin complement component [Planctomycetes bacterium Pan216]|uniref:A-macroglobulin complement component n=1 Tax=Kolteria novifilia TaxID=2527975 RepID=A0A518BD03_9BACT|nr:A-macroglobulin complement component [Planctomycetes bacterium Pan216]